ncbi:unnamed protein product [Durusdinium trenchii]|uniref:SecA family profile domain-containing protein n=1 Tax=Durusdinium trenchii TaxID=1381693 RepID=A0ABP0T193_9DINO
MPGFLSAEFSSFLHFARVALRHVRLLTCAALQVDSILIDEAWLGRRLRRDMREDPNRMKSVEKEGLCGENTYQPQARTPLIISGVADNTPTKYKVAQEVVRALKPEARAFSQWGGHRKVHYTVDEKQRQCVLIEGGVEAAEKLLGKDDLFDPEDPWFPFVTNALNAKELYIKDKAYIVKRGEVMIVDEFTGRVMEGRRWSNGLHQAIEAKENVQIQAESVTLASISYQSLFRLFDKLSGMTGTAFTEAKEFEEVYKLKTVVVPPNLVRKRADKDDQVYVDDIGKWKAVAREVENAHRIGRPVLIGTTNVENSEIIAELLDALGVAYQLLNAKPENVARETEIVASSGRKYVRGRKGRLGGGGWRFKGTSCV